VNKQETSIDTEHPFITKQKPVWKLISTLLGGTPAMIESREENLPRRKYETKERYDNRLKTATLLPAFEDAIGEMVGRAFSKPMKLLNLPSWYEQEVLNNVDMEGNSAAEYIRDWLRDAVSYGLSHTLIDAPADPGVTTLADQKKLKLRPYYVMVQAQNIVNWKTTQGVLTWLVLRLLDDDGKTFIREYTKLEGSVVSVDYDPQIADKKLTWQERDGSRRTHAVSQIPLITIYADRKRVMQSDPPLRELAYMNRKHYAMQSGIDALVDVASVPLLAIIGDVGGTASGENEQELEIGANTALNVGENGDIKYVEHSGKAIGTGQLHLEKLEDNMRRMGARMLVKNVGMASKTKNEADEDMVRENSPMSIIMGNLTNAVVQLVNLTQEWRNDAPKPITADDVKFNPNLQPNDDAVLVIKTLTAMSESNRISTQTLFEAAKLRGMIPDDVVWEEEKRRIREDVLAMVDNTGNTQDPPNDPTADPTKP